VSSTGRLLWSQSKTESRKPSCWFDWRAAIWGFVSARSLSASAVLPAYCACRKTPRIAALFAPQAALRVVS
jgi:hypothetical protein